MIEYLLIYKQNDHGLNKPEIFSLCFHGYLSIAQWLYSLGDIDIHAFDINIHDGGDYVFHQAYINGHLLVAQWLFSLGC